MWLYVILSEITHSVMACMYTMCQLEAKLLFFENFCSFDRKFGIYGSSEVPSQHPQLQNSRAYEFTVL
ncbi:hypothetical protein I7I53_06564 [Histoplasma capsulatum var. duboisii H88]|uniref:Secreted protein n=1 Tax=Ajellomyces capsulatus (strain H88) TaxID=544711 RepID=A0A8A1LFR1_AJEC8|nr:hypothetical protein I7I53_06564 [Histoplasma capsulatum var. duboisii H88]